MNKVVRDAFVDDVTQRSIGLETVPITNAIYGSMSLAHLHTLLVGSLRIIEMLNCSKLARKYAIWIYVLMCNVKFNVEPVEEH